MATNDFLAFGTAGGANVMSQSSYAALAQRTSGFVTGEADPLACNKVWRQAAMGSAVLAGIIADTGVDILDDGNITAFAAKLVAALEETLKPRLPAGTVIASVQQTGTPTGRWRLCNGAVLVRADFADLFAVIGTDFNTGGETSLQFRVPDFRGVFLRGFNEGKALATHDPGRDWATTQLSQNAAHTHQLDLYEPDDNFGPYIASDAGGDHTGTILTDPSGGSEARPINIPVRYFIAY